MPVVRTMLDMQDVMPILTRKGYGVNRNPRFGLQLTVQGKRQFSNGSFEREPLKPISKEEVIAVLEKADSFDEAALLFEKLSLGTITSAIEETRSDRPNLGLTAEDLAGIIDRRVGFEVEKRMALAIPEITTKVMAAVMAQMPKPTAPAKAGKKGGKLKRDDPKVEAALASMNLPKLPPELPPAA